MNIKKNYHNLIEQHIALFSRLSEDGSDIVEAGKLIVNTLETKNKILVCGNGGSASDAQHFAAELIGRFETTRKAFPAIALTTDTSILTALGNDFGFDTIFARQVEGLGSAGDVFLGISTSGNSKNVINAVEQAKECGMRTIGLLGNEGGSLASICDISIVVQHSVTARIQEMHIFILHFFASLVDQSFLEKK